MPLQDSHRIFRSYAFSLFDSKCVAFNIYRVGEEVVGKKYNDVWKRWFDKNFSIWVGVSENNTEYIFFMGETGLRNATVMVQNSKAIREKLKKR